MSKYENNDLFRHLMDEVNPRLPSLGLVPFTVAEAEEQCRLMGVVIKHKLGLTDLAA